MVDGQKKEKKGPNPGVDFSTALRASAGCSQAALGWEISLGFLQKSHSLCSIVFGVSTVKEMAVVPYLLVVSYDRVSTYLFSISAIDALVL